MDFKRLADVIRKFWDVEYLIDEIETLSDDQGIETVDDLTEFLEDKLDYANE